MLEQKPMSATKAKNKMDAPQRVVLYARVSTEEQSRSEYPNCRSQIESLREFATQRGWAIVDELCEDGFSLDSPDRPQLTRLRGMVAEGEIDVIATTYYDRLTRSRDFFEMDREFKAKHVKFTTMFDPADSTTAAGRFMEMMLVAVKAYEREINGQKISTALRRRAANGLPVGRPKKVKNF